MIIVNIQKQVFSIQSLIFKKQIISVVDDQINNPYLSKSMSKIIGLCIEKEISGIYHWG